MTKKIRESSEFSPEIIKRRIGILSNMFKNNVKPDYDDLNMLITIRRVDFVKKALKSGVKPDSESLYRAIIANDAEIVKLIIQAGVKPTEDDLKDAILINANDDIIKILVDSGVCISSDVINRAKSKGIDYATKLLKLRGTNYENF